jgi:hypothetical protein
MEFRATSQEAAMFYPIVVLPFGAKIVKVNFRAWANSQNWGVHLQVTLSREKISTKMPQTMSIFCDLL